MLVVGLVLALSGCQKPAAEAAGSTPASRPAVTDPPTPSAALKSAQHMPGSFWQHAVEQVSEPIAQIRAETKAEMALGVDTAKFVRGNRQRRQICLTFDDGPHPGKTEPLLAILRNENVKATFFVVGEMAVKSPHLIRAEAADGHEIGSHTYHHVNMTKVSPTIVKTELLATDEALRAILGHGASLLRPPGGQHNAQTIDVARGIGYTTVLWTDDPGDYDPKISPELILRRTIRDATPGGIILLHDGPDTTMAILPRLIHYLRAQGYTFVTAGELLRDARPQTK